jgi:hypothetical protein
MHFSPKNKHTFLTALPLLKGRAKYICDQLQEALTIIITRACAMLKSSQLQIINCHLTVFKTISPLIGWLYSKNERRYLKNIYV